MKSDSIAFGIAGVVFGLIAGWIIGSQQASVAAAGAPAAQAAAPAARIGVGAAAPPLLDETKVNAFKSVAEREPRTPSRASSSATSTSTPSATTTRSSGTARR